MKSPQETASILNLQQRRSRANRVTLVGSVVNLILSGFKLLAGVLGRSHAMVADAVHSLSDLGTDIAVLVGIYLASSPEDKGHNYGHGKYETFATLIIAITLFAVGIGIGWSGIQKIVLLTQGESLPVPGWIALGAAITSIVVKEILFRYTKVEGEKINSTSLVANAYHHRSDALSSLGTGIGILGAIILGEKWVVLDPLAALVVSALILREAVHIGYTSINDLLEASIPEEEQEKIMQIASNTAGVIDAHNLKTRRIGATIALDLHIRVEDSISVCEGHEIAHKVEDEISNEFGANAICTIHVEPESSLRDS
jgi:cation diffusion facilitator family transporter